MLEPLGTAVKADMVMAATQQRIKEVGVEVILEAARVHLNRQFVHCHNRDRQSVVFVVNGVCGFAGLDHLSQAVQLGIGDTYPLFVLFSNHYHCQKCPYRLQTVFSL